MKRPFRRAHLWLALGILGLEVHIAWCWNDAWVRPYGGDTLAVVLLYALARGTGSCGPSAAAVGSLALAFGLEVAQHFELVEQLGLGRYQLARIVLGTTFHPGDLLAYTLGASVAWLCETRVGALRAMLRLRPRPRSARAGSSPETPPGTSDERVRSS